jgi:hypothetical protein
MNNMTKINKTAWAIIEKRTNKIKQLSIGANYHWDEYSGLMICETKKQAEQNGNYDKIFDEIVKIKLINN